MKGILGLLNPECKVSWVLTAPLDSETVGINMHHSASGAIFVVRDSVFLPTKGFDASHAKFLAHTVGICLRS